MPIAYRSAGSYASGVGNVTPGLPTGWAENDIFLLWVEGDNLASLSTPSGWNFITSDSGSESTTAAYWRRATSSESAPTYTDTGDHTSAIIEAYSGCYGSGSPIVTSAVNSIGTTTISWASVTTTRADQMVAGAVGLAAAGQTLVTGPTNANLTSLTNPTANSHSNGNAGGIITFYGLQAAVGASGATTGTIGTSCRKNHITVVLKAAAPNPLVPPNYSAVPLLIR